MQCERCGAPREEGTRVCARCGNEFSQPAVENTSIPSIDSVGVEPQAEQASLAECVAAQKDIPVQEDVPTSDNTSTSAVADVPSSDGGSADAGAGADAMVEPVFNPVVTPTQDSSATTVVPVVKSAVTPGATVSPQMSGSVTAGQNTNATSFFASKKNRNLAFIGAAIVVVLVIAFNVFNYFSGLIGPNDVKQIISSDTEFMQGGIIPSRYVAPSTYTVKDVVVEEQKDVTADIRTEYGNMAVGADSSHVMRARIKATIANENFETTFVTNILVTKTPQGWKGLAPMAVAPKDATTTPLKGVDKSDNYSSKVECSGSDLQNNNGTYTSTINVTSHDENWYGKTDYSWSDVYTFSNDKGWSLDHSTKDDPTIKVDWNMKGKTYDYASTNDFFRHDNISLTINDINDKTADISYSIASEPASSSSSAKSINLSGRKTATIKAQRGGNISVELNDADNGVTITINGGEKKRVAGRGEVDALVVSIETQSDDGTIFGGKYSKHCVMIEKAQ